MRYDFVIVVDASGEIKVSTEVKSRRHELEVSSDSAACAGQRENLTFQAHPANVFKPSKSGSRSVAGVSHCRPPACMNGNRMTCSRAVNGQAILLGGGGGTFW